jgi:hypothetical protein
MIRSSYRRPTLRWPAARAYAFARGLSELYRPAEYCLMQPARLSSEAGSGVRACGRARAEGQGLPRGTEMKRDRSRVEGSQVGGAGADRTGSRGDGAERENTSERACGRRGECAKVRSRVGRSRARREVGVRVASVSEGTWSTSGESEAAQRGSRVGARTREDEVAQGQARRGARSAYVLACARGSSRDAEGSADQNHGDEW